MKESPNCTIVEVTPSTSRTKPRTKNMNGSADPLPEVEHSNRKRHNESTEKAPAKNSAKNLKRSRKKRNESESSEVEVKVTGKEVKFCHVK